MARPLRIDVQDGWYHVMSRGTDRREIFTGDAPSAQKAGGTSRDCGHFLELLEEMVERYGVKVHAYVLMWNHYHLLVQTPHGNLSRAMQWLNVSYGVWFNRKHERVGPLLQGRFKSVPIDGEGFWALQASVYLHLNPVRVKGLGLGKRERKAEGLGLSPPPSPELVKARLETLRGHQWSSYPAYAGYAPRPAWLTCEDLWQRARRGGVSVEVAYRWHVETPLKAEVKDMETFGERVRGALAVGSEAFMDRLRRLAHGNPRTQPAVRKWQRELPFTRVIAAVAAQKGESWERFWDRHGDEGRDMALWLGRRHCGLTLAELGAATGGLSAAAAGAGVRRMDQRRLTDAENAKVLNRAEDHLLESET